MAENGADANSLGDILAPMSGVDFSVGAGLSTLEAVGVLCAAVGLTWLVLFRISRRIISGARTREALRHLVGNVAERFVALLKPIYRDTVSRLLTWIARRAGERGALRRNAGRHLTVRAAMSSAWTGGLYQFSLLLALVYPLVFLAGNWLLTGQTMEGLTAVLAPEQSARLGSFALLIVAGAFVYGVEGADTVAVTVAGAVGLAFAAALVVVGADVVAGALVIAVAGGILGAVLGDFAAAFSGADSLAVAVAGVVAAAIAIALAVWMFLLWLGEILGGRGVGYYAIHWLLFMGLAAGAVYGVVVTWGGEGRVLQFLVLFGFLPLANAPLDWASIGLTRGFLRVGLAFGGRWRIFAMVVFDGVASVGFMFLLAVLTTMVIGVANSLALLGGGATIIPLRGVFAGLSNLERHPELIWIYALFLTTLAPTAVHVLSGLAGVSMAIVMALLWPFKRAKDFLKHRVTVKDSVPDGIAKGLYPALAAMLAMAMFGGLAVAMSMWVVPHGAAALSEIGGWLLATAVWTAALFPGY